MTSNLVAPEEAPPPKLSPVHSMAVHSEAVWGVTGTESGNIHLYSIRHEEGKLLHILRGHKSPVSTMKISPNEKGLITGSWDKSIKSWNMDIGTVIRTFSDPTSQITSLEYQPSGAITDGSKEQTVFMATSFDGAIFVYDTRSPKGLIKKMPSSMCKSPPWSLSVI